MTRPWMRLGCGILGLAIALAGCGGGGGDPLSEHAEEVYDRYVAESSDFRAYAVSLATNSRSERARRLLAEAIRSPERGIAMEAIHGMDDVPDPELRAAVREVFDSRSGALKLSAALALARSGEADALAWLRTQLDDAGALPGADAFKILAAAGDREKVQAVLADRVASEDAAVRDEVYRILGEIGTSWAAKMLLEGLEREHGEGRREAIVALGRCGSAADAAKIRPFTNTRGLVLPSIEALGALGDTASAPALKKLLAHEEPRVVLYAAVALLKIDGDASSREAVERVRADADPAVRRLLAEQLAALDPAASGTWLAALAGDEHKDVQVEALRALAAGGTPQAVETAAGLVNDPDYEVATLALNLLAAHGTTAERSALEGLLDSPNPYVALSAADAMLAIGDRAGEGESPG